MMCHIKLAKDIVPGDVIIIKTYNQVLTKLSKISRSAIVVSVPTNPPDVTINYQGEERGVKLFAGSILMYIFPSDTKNIAVLVRKHDDRIRILLPANPGDQTLRTYKGYFDVTPTDK